MDVYRLIHIDLYVIKTLQLYLTINLELIFDDIYATLYISDL